MHSQVEELSPVEKKVEIEVDWPQVAKKLDDAYRELGKDVSLKGFRKGKVPRSMLERMYGRQVEQEVKQRLVQENFMRAAQQHSIQMVADPIIDEMSLEPNKGFRFTARVEVQASFDPVDYFDVAIEREQPTVTDEEIARALKQKQREFTEYKKIDGRTVLGAGDTVFVDVDGQVGPHPVKREAAAVDVGLFSEGESEPELVPGLGAALVGQPVDAKDHELVFTTPSKSGEGEGPAERAELRDARGQEARVRITVREAREKLVPVLDDDFAKDTGDAETLEELRGKLRGKLVADKERAQQHEVRSELLKKILEKNPFQVAPALVDRQADQMMNRSLMQLRMQGIDPRTLNLDESRIKEEMRPGAIEAVRSMFKLDAVATKEKIEVTDADLEKRLAEMAKDRGKNAQRLKAELQKDNKLDQVRHQLREEKTLDLLMSRANVTVKH